MSNKKFILILLLLASIIGGLIYWIFFPKQQLIPSQKITANLVVRKNLIPVEEVQIKTNRLERLSETKGLRDAVTTDKYISQQAVVVKASDQISNYQAYVTPDNSAVIARAKDKSTESIYQDALSWVWVEDIVLNREEDKWLSPQVFLEQTPTMSTNPASGKIASDCEEHAYTLVSMLRAAGVAAENVRVVTGKVDFSGSIGGHAWVELYDSDKKSWFQLEPSSGINYDSAKKVLIESSGLAFDYFKMHQYPAVEIWTYFNDQYFWDNNTQHGKRPANWENNTSVIITPTSLPTPISTITLTPSLTPLLTPLPTMATMSAEIKKQLALSNSQIQWGTIQMLVYLQQKKDQSSVQDLSKILVAGINESSLSDFQKETLNTLITKINSLYGTDYTNSDLVKIQQEILAVFQNGQISTTPMPSATISPQKLRQQYHFRRPNYSPPTVVPSQSAQ